MQKRLQVPIAIQPSHVAFESATMRILLAAEKNSHNARRTTANRPSLLNAGVDMRVPGTKTKNKIPATSDTKPITALSAALIQASFLNFLCAKLSLNSSTSPAESQIMGYMEKEGHGIEFSSDLGILGKR
jgi:hypothetical protein